MKKMLSKMKSAGVVNFLALAVAAISANQACLWFFHQPEFPEAAKKLKKH